MNRNLSLAAFAVGLGVLLWVGVGFVGVSPLALLMTLLIAAVYLLGAWELLQFHHHTNALGAALAELPPPQQQLPDLGAWLGRVPAALQAPVRQRVAGERAGLPGPALTPYLVGLLVMLGMLGTFLGMIVTFKGAVFALEGSTDLAAIRAALAAPIKGLGLAFGTSVAGVAASAMLGLMSALCRRERVAVSRALDACVAGVLRPLSRAQQRDDTFQALQVQAQAWPQVMDRLQTMLDGLERRSQQLSTQLLDQQSQFHHHAGLAYAELAREVGTALTTSLTASATAAGASLQPVVETAMREIAQESERRHQQVLDAAQTQLNGLNSQFAHTATSVAEGWTGALAQHTRSSASQAEALAQALSGFTTSFEQRAAALLDSVQQHLAESHASHSQADAQRLSAWTQALDTTSATLQAHWQQVGAQGLAQQQATSQALAHTADQMAERASQHTSQTLAEMTRLLTQSEALLRTRAAAEADATRQHGAHLAEMAQLWRTEMAALRDDEARRGDAAVARLGELQSALASHLATLGSALEAPMTRLMASASEAPQAAAEVIVQLRREMSHVAERDTQALAERHALMAQIGTLMHSLNQASGEQRAAIDALLASATSVLQQASGRFSDTLDAHAGQAAGVAAHVAGSAVELASLGEAFNHGITLFSASNQQLLDGLQGVEGALQQAMARSDEQLAYYVAQAREVIDLSISAQHAIVDDLRRLRGQAGAAAAAGGL